MTLHASLHAASIRPPGAPAESVVVIGGGLAGIAAAVRLAKRGLSVTLVETRKRLGGRATSFVDPVTGQILDNCQHVLLGCCTNLLDLYDHLGVRDKIHWHQRLYFRGPGPEPVIDRLEADDLPAPAHLTRAMMGFRSLTWPEKFAIARGMYAIMRTTRAQRDALNDRTFAQWLAENHQPPGAIEKYWALVVVSAINELPGRMAANHAIQVFQEGFLANENAYVMGLPTVSLVELYDQAQRVITSTGGTLMLSTSAEALDFDRGRITGLHIDGYRRLQADAYVSALPFDRLAKLCSPAMLAADQRLAALTQFQVSPIIGIHMWFNPPEPAVASSQSTIDNRQSAIFPFPHLILMNSPLQWVFNKGWDSQVGGQHLHGVISAAHDLVDTPADDLLAMAAAELRRALPDAGVAQARLVHGRVVKEKRATFSAAPGLDALRPAAVGAIPNLFLAGDWCRTGWPATMEGAVRSGYLAGGAILGEDMLVPDLPSSSLYRFLAG